MKNYLTNLVLVGFLSIFPSNILADPVLIDDLYYELNKMYVPDEYLEELKIPFHGMIWKVFYLYLKNKLKRKLLIFL